MNEGVRQALAEVQECIGLLVAARWDIVYEDSGHCSLCSVIALNPSIHEDDCPTTRLPLAVARLAAFLVGVTA